MGEVLRGDRIIVSDYELTMVEDQEMRYLCSTQIDVAGLERAKQLIRDRYEVEWIVDNLPSATSYLNTDNSGKYYSTGFKLGYEEMDPRTRQVRHMLNNHVTIMIRYRRAAGKAGDRGRKVIVGFEVFPRSVEAENRFPESGLPKALDEETKGFELDMAYNRTYTGPEAETLLTVPYTYSVYFREDESVDWQNRWQAYLGQQEGTSKIHWVAIANSVIICALLTAVVSVILVQTIFGDVQSIPDIRLEGGKVRLKRKTGTRTPQRGLEMQTGLLDKLESEGLDPLSDDEGPEELTGWKLVHGDVFRAPRFGLLLAPIIGSGAQVIVVVIAVQILSCLGLLNPSFRGGYVSIGVILYFFSGWVAGYLSARTFKTFGGVDWKRNMLITGSLLPAVIFAITFNLNLIVWAQGSSSAIPFGTLFALVSLWLFVQMPLTYVGSWLGFVRSEAWEQPLRPNAIARQIPAQSWYMKGIRIALLAGALPFALVFIETTFLFQALWADKGAHYYTPGYMALNTVLLMLCVVEVTIIAVYAQLCAENYKWWWQSFLVGASSSVWLFLYCIYWYFTRLYVKGFVSGLLFFAYAGIGGIVYGLFTGTVGFIAAYGFVRTIYRYA